MSTIVARMLMIATVACSITPTLRRSTHSRKTTARIIKATDSDFDSFVSIERATAFDLQQTTDICIRSFFGEANGNPIRALHLKQLRKEQSEDIGKKMMDSNSSFFKATFQGQLVGFVELSLSTSLKYLGSDIPQADARPVLANLAVQPEFRGRGLGGRLVEACEREATAWGYGEVVLMVDVDNVPARKFYASKGYDELYCDRAARRYDARGLILTNIRVSRWTLRKVLPVPQRIAGPMNPLFFFESLQGFMTSALSRIKPR
jgi:ribosomal protein S18 acetylase RimI-like enzyme